MSVHARGVLTFHHTFIESLAVYIIIEAIVNKVSWDGRDAEDFLMSVDVSGSIGLLAWDMLSCVEDQLHFFICGIYHSNLVVDGIFQHDNL